MNAQDVIGLAAAITVMLAALAAIGKAVQVAVQGARRIFRLVDDLAGEPPGPSTPNGRPGLLERLATIETNVAAIPPLLIRVTALEARAAALEERMAAVEAQLIPNGGGSLRDSVDRVAAAVVPADPPEPASSDAPAGTAPAPGSR